MLHASGLPQLRDEMHHLVTAPDSALRSQQSIEDDYGSTLDIVGRHVATGRLYWVTSDMAALATSAGRTLDSLSVAPEDRPAPTGLMVMHGGIGWMPYNGEELPVDAVSWGPAPGGTLLSTWVERERINTTLNGRGRVDSTEIPPLVPMSGTTLPADTAECPLSHIEEQYRTIVATVCAAWHLMQQPSLSEQADHPLPRSRRRAYTRHGHHEPQVTLIELRSRYRPPDDENADTTPRAYRSVVTGHWKHQPYGPEQAYRKRIFIPDYIRGPDESPLLIRERVNVWRR